MVAGAHILVVDDEAEMRDAVSEYLVLRGFSVSTAANGEKMRKILDGTTVDLVLLDLGLPGENGIDLLRELRKTRSFGIIIVTAFGEAEDRVLGLESGADDYVVKPFQLRELLARVRSVLRRSEDSTEPLASDEDSGLVFIGENSYDRKSREFRSANGSVIKLSSGDCDLLELFLKNPNRALTRDELVEQTTHRSWEPFDRSIDVRINRLRRNIEQDSAHPQLIRTVRGVGYLFHSNN